MAKLWLITLHIICALNFIYCEVGVKSRQILPSYAGLQNTNDYRYENATMDAQNLYNAVTGIGTSEDVIINILTNRTNQQRQAIKPVYKEMFNKDLVDDLKSDSSGNFKSVVKAIMLEPHYYLARKLKKALTSFITDDDCVTEILCTKHKDDLILIMNAYEAQFNKTLKSQIDESLEGDQKAFLKYLLSDKLRPKGELNPSKSNEQMNTIPNALDFCTIKENGYLKELLSKESFEQIALVEVMLEKSKNKTIVEQLKKWCTKDTSLLSAYETVVRYAIDPMRYYAEELYKAMIGLGTNDDKLIRIIVGRSEIDLFNIKNKYQDIYHTSLISSVEAETSGDYEKILVRLIQNSDQKGVSRSYYS